MISVIYRNKSTGYRGPVNYGGYGHNQSGPLFDPTPTRGAITQPALAYTHISEAATRAAKIGITTIEWQRRDHIVRRLYAQNTSWNFMDVFYPCMKEYYTDWGKCWYMGSVKSYKEIDHTEWPKDDLPMIFTARPINAPNPECHSDFLCNYDFMCKTEPTE